MSYNLFIGAWCLLVYCPLAHWVWSMKLTDAGAVVPAGWIGALGAVDFAGGMVIHTAAGFSALATSLCVGARLVKRDPVIDVTKIVTGTGLLWFGWFGFNGGSAGASNSIATNACLSTHIATCAAVLVWMMCEYVHCRKTTMVGACTAVVIGLVAITPGSGFVAPMPSIGVGGITALLCYLTNQLKVAYLSQYLDDTLDVFLCHGVAGFAGSILVGVFASTTVNTASGLVDGSGRLLGVQIASTVACAAYACAMSCAILLLLKYSIGIRVDAADEMLGLDRAHDTQDGRDNSCAPTDDDEPFAVVFTDIEKSTRLWSADAAGMTRAIEMHHTLIREVIKRYGMYEVKTVGDAFMITGSSVAKALRLALDIQTEFHAKKWDMPWIDDVYNAANQKKRIPGDRQSVHSGRSSQRAGTGPFQGLRVRVGVHFGYGKVQFDSVVKGYDYFGTVVNAAARIEALGHGGQLLVSELAWNEAKLVDPSIVDGVLALTLGEQRLRGIGEAYTLYQLTPSALAARRFPPLRHDHAGTGGSSSDRTPRSPQPQAAEYGASDSLVGPLPGDDAADHYETTDRSTSSHDHGAPVIADDDARLRPERQ